MAHQAPVLGAICRPEALLHHILLALLEQLQAIERQSTGSEAGPIVLGPAPGALERLAIRDRVLGLRADVDAVRVLLVLDLLNPGDIVRELLGDEGA